MKQENLVMLIEQTRAEVAELEGLRKKAWSCEGHHFGTLHMVCLGYHARFQHWQQAAANLERLERQLREQRGAQP